MKFKVFNIHPILPLLQMFLMGWLTIIFIIRKYYISLILFGFLFLIICIGIFISAMQNKIDLMKGEL
jgi:hypothetical protein